MLVHSDMLLNQYLKQEDERILAEKNHGENNLRNKFR